MSERLNNTIEILEKLVSFKSVSGTPTFAIVDYIRQYLAEHNVDVTLSFDESGERSNLFATIGPEIDGGVVLNGHFDVVPVTGQTWATDPFQLSRKGNRLYGRGSVDMKGFLACVLGMVAHFQSKALKKPIHIAFTYDEEVGGFGMPVLLNSMAEFSYRPEIVIVGEPTEMKLVTEHKGGYEMRTEVTGYAAHACDPSKGVNAISIAMKLIARMEELAEKNTTLAYPGSLLSPPYPTFNVGTIEGGAARNVTAGWCCFDWEYRTLPGRPDHNVILEIENYAKEELLPGMRAMHPNTDIRMIQQIYVPALDDRNAAKAAELVSSITGANERHGASFGTDAGYFSDAGFSTVVCGPGNLDRAHKPDEYITIEELSKGLSFLETLADRLC